MKQSRASSSRRDVETDEYDDWTQEASAVDVHQHASTVNDEEEKKIDGGSPASPRSAVVVWVVRHGQRLGEVGRYTRDRDGKKRAHKDYEEWSRGVPETNNPSDDPLTEEGFRQAIKSASGFSKAYEEADFRPTFDAIYSSPLQRCAHTAVAFSSVLKAPLKMHAGLGACAMAFQRQGVVLDPKSGWFAFDRQCFPPPTQENMALQTPSQLKARHFKYDSDGCASKVRWTDAETRPLEDFSFESKRYFATRDGFCDTVEEIAQQTVRRRNEQSTKKDSLPHVLVVTHREGVQQLLKLADREHKVVVTYASISCFLVEFVDDTTKKREAPSTPPRNVTSSPHGGPACKWSCLLLDSNRVGSFPESKLWRHKGSGG